MKTFTFSILLLLVLSPLALAQDIPVSPPNNINGPVLAGYCGFAYMIINSVVSSMREDNIVITWAPPVLVRVIAALFGGAIQTCLMAITTGIPWSQALGAAVVTVSAAWITSGKRVKPGVSSTEAIAQKSGKPPVEPTAVVEVIPPPPRLP